MKIYKIERLLLIRSIAFMMLFLVPLYTQAATISFSAPNISVQTGNTFTVDLLADFSVDSTLGGGLDIFYDTTVLSFEMFDFSSSTLGQDSLFNRNPDSLSDKLEGLAFGDFNGINTSGTVGTFTFRALMVGMTQLQLAVTNNVLGGGPFISGVDFMTELDIVAGSSEVTVTSPAVVPVPAAVWLFGSALGILLMRSRVKA